MFHFWLRLLLIFISLGALGSRAHAEEMIHHGPVLDIQVQRGNDTLPLFHVPRLRKGDQVRVQPDMRSLAKGEWVLLLARVSPSGNQVETFGFDLNALEAPATLEITSDEQVPVILLAPQLRNLFGLYTSFSESADLLKQALLADPQRFFDLQKLDQINQAITALSQGLEQVVLNRSPEQGITAAKALAIKFGVRSIDPECFKNNSVNTQCVAANIVANKDFVLPAISELGMVMGQKKAADLTSFLTSNIRVFSEAGDFLTHKFRDQYDFAPTFGRRKGDTWKTELYALARFRNGNIKTAYVYVPAWFTGSMPGLTVDDIPPACLSGGRLEVRISGRLPVMNYWHGWDMTLRHPQTKEILAQLDDIQFVPERGVFQFGEVVVFPADMPPTSEVTASIKGNFGFDGIEISTFRLALPPQGDLLQHLSGTAGLISGEAAELNLGTPQTLPCVDRLTLERQGVTLARSKSEAPNQLKVDLSQVSPGEATMWVTIKGAEPQTLLLSIQRARAHVKQIAHAELDDHLQVIGEQLERIASVQVGHLYCVPLSIPVETKSHVSLSLTCPEGIRNNARLADWVTVHHRENEPPSFQSRLKKTAAVPRFQMAKSAQALLVRPSSKALQWGLVPHEIFFSEDSGLSLLLQSVEGYALARGNYTLQLRFVDDPITSQTPITAPLMADFPHQELRTRTPLTFKGLELPSVINPLEFRVQHDSSGLQGAWSPLNRAVLMLPDLHKVSCATSAGKMWVHGTQLELLDGAAWHVQGANSFRPVGELPASVLEPCPDGLCLVMPVVTGPHKLSVALHWVNQRTFSLDLGELPNCANH